MEFALAFYYKLLKLFALLYHPCRVFLTHACQYGRQFLCIRFCFRTYGALVLGSRIFYEVELVFAAFLIQRIACAHILKLYGRAYITGF